MLDNVLSRRAGTIKARQGRPWRYAAPATYHPEDNPSGLISFALAENVRETKIPSYPQVQNNERIWKANS